MNKLYFAVVNSTHYPHNNNTTAQRFLCYDKGTFYTKKTTLSLCLLTYSAGIIMDKIKF